LVVGMTVRIDAERIPSEALLMAGEWCYGRTEGAVPGITPG